MTTSDWTDTSRDRARALHRETTVVDAHSDLPLLLIKSRMEGQYNTLGQKWIPQMREAGLDVILMSIAVDATFLPEMALRRALQEIDAVYEEVRLNADQIAICTSKAEIERTLAAGRIAVVLILEGGEPLGQDLSALRMLHRLGVMSMMLTWSRRSFFADGAFEGRTGGGLTRLGVEAVKEMNRLGILVDVAHLSDAGFWDLIKVNTRPVIDSHTCCRALCDHSRNLTDEQIRALGETGGVLGITAVASFTDPESPTIARLVDHVVHAVDLIGIDRVGIGLDLTRDVYEAAAYTHVGYIDGGPGTLVMATPTAPRPHQRLEGLEVIPDIPNLTAEMLRRGFSEHDVKKVIGGNFLRIFGEVW